MKTIVSAFSFIVSCAVAFATAQFPDKITIGSNEQEMICNPLESYLEKFPKKRPRDGIQSTALWRGYVAHFEIREEVLWVKDIKIEVTKKGSKAPEWESEWRSVLQEVFPKTSDRKADWFTGFLILPLGEMTHYVHMGYASEYEQYRLVFVRKGKVKANRVFTTTEYAEYKQLQFKAFSKTERYQAMKKQVDDKGRDAYSLNAENFLYIFDVTFPVEILIDYKDFKPNTER
ncbi:MAG: hypothetical protein HZA31_11600 [Opitutae bacterium]|nr:hypothetical protein [Opitutae bacterium]